MLDGLWPCIGILAYSQPHWHHFFDGEVQEDFWQTILVLSNDIILAGLINNIPINTSWGNLIQQSWMFSNLGDLIVISWPDKCFFAQGCELRNEKWNIIWSVNISWHGYKHNPMLNSLSFGRFESFWFIGTICNCSYRTCQQTMEDSVDDLLIFTTLSKLKDRLYNVLPNTGFVSPYSPFSSLFHQI